MNDKIEQHNFISQSQTVGPRKVKQRNGAVNAAVKQFNKHGHMVRALPVIFLGELPIK
jgi:hypothetical protein